MRPGGAEYWSAVMGRAVVMVPFIGFSLIRALGRSDTLLERIAVPVGILALVAVLIVLSIVHIRTSVVRLSPGSIEHHALLFRDRTLSTAGIDGVLTSMTQPLVPATEILVLRSPQQRATVRLSGGLWTHDTLETIARHAGVEVSAKPMSGTDIERRVPKSMPMRYRRPWLFGLGLALLVTAAITVGVVGWFAYKDLPPFDDQPPEAVSAVTVRSHDGVVEAIQVAFPGTWEPERVRLLACENDDDVKGWKRSVDLDRAAGSARPDDATLDTLDATLVSLGYDELDRDNARDGGLTLSTLTDGPGFDVMTTTVEIYQLSGTPVAVGIHGPCEVPADLEPGDG